MKWNSKLQFQISIQNPKLERGERSVSIKKRRILQKHTTNPKFQLKFRSGVQKPSYRSRIEWNGKPGQWLWITSVNPKRELNPRWLILSGTNLMHKMVIKVYKLLKKQMKLSNWVWSRGRKNLNKLLATCFT